VTTTLFKSAFHGLTLDSAGDTENGSGRNPVTRGLVKDPKDWVWSSYSSYFRRGTPLLTIDFVD